MGHSKSLLPQAINESVAAKGEIMRSALFSDDRACRYWLIRCWDEKLPKVMFIGLNPSTADEKTDDPTIRRVIQIAAFNGFGTVIMANCFPFVTPYPDEVLEQMQLNNGQVAIAYNNAILRAKAEECVEVVFAWGNFKIIRDLGKDKQLKELFPRAKALHINKHGSPKHPLYCRANSLLIPFQS
jgi:hypothetical protein